jgi:hypothetical protein
MSFSLKLDVSTDSVLCACSLCEMMMEKINTLQQTIKTIEAVEIHLFEGVVEKLKGVTLRIKTAQDTIVESCNSKNWDDAISATYERIFNYFKASAFQESID